MERSLWLNLFVEGELKMFKWIFDKTLVAQGMAAQNTSGRISTIDIQQGPGLLKRHQRSLDSKLRQNL